MLARHAKRMVRSSGHNGLARFVTGTLRLPIVRIVFAVLAGVS